MKKSGFTLAEILITLAIVGIVAALAIPTLVTKATRQAEATKLSVTVKALEEAFGNMITDMSADSLHETGVFTVANLRKQLPITETGSKPSELGYSSDSPYYKLDGTATDDGINAWNGFVLKNNAIILYTASIDTCSGGTICDTEDKSRDIIIDTNGPVGPNRWGRDVFGFGAGSTGKMYPLGSQDYQDISGQHDTPISDCPANSWSCAYRLVKNNYRVDY